MGDPEIRAYDPEFKSHLAVELIPGGVDCPSSEVGKMSASLLVSCVRLATRPGLCPLAKETAEAAPTLCTEYGPNGWMDGMRGNEIKPRTLSSPGIYKHCNVSSDS